MSSWQRLGLAIGHATDESGATGCTVVRGFAQPFRCAAALIGRASGSRELAPAAEHLIDHERSLAHDGSAYSLDTAGVMRWMEERGRGLDVGRESFNRTGAVIFDLAPLGSFDARPTDMAGACSATMHA
jgi:L-aminopeptidase/D-esterase-like protein